MWTKLQSQYIETKNLYSSKIPFKTVNDISDFFITDNEKYDVLYYGWSADQLILLSYAHLLNSNETNWYNLISTTCLANQDIVNINIIAGYWYFMLYDKEDIRLKLEFVINNKTFDFTEVDEYCIFFNNFLHKYKIL